MSLRDGLLFLHLTTMAAYLMLFGIEWLAVGTILRLGKGAALETWFAILRRVLTASQVALTGILLTGGPLVDGVKPADRAGFGVTLGVFVAIGALTGISARTYRAFGTGRDARWSVAAPSIAIRASLVAATMLLVSAKPDLTISLLASGVALAFGIVTGAVVGRRSSRFVGDAR